MVPEQIPSPEPDAPRDERGAQRAHADLPDLVRTDGPQRGAAARLALIIAAIVFFILGIVFWLIPILTGLPFYLLGFVCLGMASRRVANWVNRQERRLPERVRLWLRPKLRRKR